MMLNWWKDVSEVIVLVVEKVGFELLELWLWSEEGCGFCDFGAEEQLKAATAKSPYLRPDRRW